MHRMMVSGLCALLICLTACRADVPSGVVQPLPPIPAETVGTPEPKPVPPEPSRPAREEADTPILPGQVPVMMQRRGVSVLDTQGVPHEVMYYELPVLFSIGKTWDAPEDPAITRINDYYLRACEEFFSGENEADFFEQLEQRVHSPYWHHLSNKITTEVVHNGDNLFSVRQGLYWMAGGVNGFRDYGAVFRPDTGEQLGLDDFIDLPYAEFWEKVCAFYTGEMREAYFEIGSLETRLTQRSYADVDFYYMGGDLYLLLHDAQLVAEHDHVIRWSLAENAPVELLYGYSDPPPPAGMG